LAPWFAVDAVYAAGDLQHSRVLAVLRVRSEELALSCTIDDASTVSSAALDLLEARMLPFWCRIAVIFMSPAAAARLVDRQYTSQTRVLSQLFASGAIAPGVFVPAGGGHSDLKGCVRAVRAIAGEAPVQHVRFDDPGDAPQPCVLAAAGLTIDSTYALGAAHSDAYVRAGAYCPQPFDRRTPAGSRHAGVIEIVRVVGPPSKDGWRGRVGFDRARLLPLLTFSRIEAYHRDEEQTVRGAQAYDRYRVYNWPPPDPPTRVTWFDAGGGALHSAWRLASAMARCRRVARTIGPRAAICDGPSLAMAAGAEAAQRLPAGVGAALDHQIALHDYLWSVPIAGPLRADYERFVHMLPPALGETLEIGSGRGQLAACLARRSSRYTCVDLGGDALADVRSRLGLPGVVGDVHALPFRAETFESVIANNVLEHAYDVLRSLGEVKRVLRPGGRLHALIPLDGLNPLHQLRAHWWKADETAIGRAWHMAGLVCERFEPIDMYALGIHGAFPATNGMTCAVTGMRP